MEMLLVQEEALYLFLELEKINHFFPITHKDMTRFLITLDHSVNFVYESLK